MSECNCSCSCSEGATLVFACSGGSNVGQIANAAAVKMDQSGQARMYCLAGVAAHISGMVDSAKSVSSVIVIDGCAVACARIALEHVGVHVNHAIIVTDLGIQKNHQFEWTDEQVATVLVASNIPEVA